MRTTNMMMVNSFLRNLYNNNTRLNTYQNQLSSNKQILRPSDDPIGTVRSIQTRKASAAKEDYKSTAKSAQDVLTQTESCLTNVTDILKRMVELVGVGESDVYDAAQKNAAAQEVLQLRDEIIDIGNTTYNGRYIFAGYNTTKAPFEVDASGSICLNGVSLDASSAALDEQMAEIMQYQLDSATDFDVSVNGAEFMGVGEENLYNLFTEIADVLSNPDSASADIQGYDEKIEAALERNLASITDVGGRQARLNLIVSRFEDDLLNLEEKRSNIEDIDPAEIITKYRFAYTAYEQSLAVGAQVIQPTLLDYIR